jgi:negative regulator of flagellin synthesis FlgM
MKIDSEQLLATVNKFKNEPAEKNETSGTAGDRTIRPGADRVELSGQQVEIDRLKKTLQDSPDVRSDRVAQLKEQIAAGTYHVEGSVVAKKMLQSWRDLNGN